MINNHNDNISISYTVIEYIKVDKVVSKCVKVSSPTHFRFELKDGQLNPIHFLVNQKLCNMIRPPRFGRLVD